METEHSTSNRCPPVEDLSAWFDKEFSDASIDKHVKGCEFCQECIQDFERINESIEVNIKVDDETLLKISEKCINQISRIRTNKDKTEIPIWLKIAACLLIVGVVFALRSTPTNIGENNQGVVAQGQKQDNIVNNSSGIKESEMALAGEPSKRNVAPTTVSMEGLTFRSNQMATSKNTTRGSLPVGIQSSINSENIKLVGFDIPETNHPSFNDSVEENFYHAPEYLIDDYVHHVWSVDDPKVPLKALKNFLNSQDQIFDNLIEENRDRYQLRFSIDDKSLFDLVNHLSGIGCELLSPGASPQLESFDIPGFNGKIIRYELEIVTK